MTNREKFIKTFGIDITEIESIDWGRTYSKYKEWCFILYDRVWDREGVNDITRKTKLNKVEKEICRVTVIAPTEKIAREKAIKAFGNKYQRYESNRPLYFIKRLENEQNEN